MSKTKLIKEEILDMIRLGIIGPGDKVPSIRSMAKKHGVSITPVNDAYNALVAMQLVESRPQSGYYVSSSTEHLQEYAKLHLHASLNKSEHYSVMDDFFAGYSAAALNANNDIRFSFGSTSATSSVYPEKDFNSCLADCMHRLKSGDNRQVILHDELPLKKSILKWMQRCRCKTSIEDISIVRSVTEGVMLAVRACSERGSLIATEAPGHIGFYFIAKFLDREVLPIPSHPDTGLDIDALEELLRRGVGPGCLLLTSAFSNPTGAVMSEDRKRRLTTLCREYSLPIIEDDTLGELYFGESRPLPLKSYDDDNVIYVSGFGKCLTPTARLAYVSAGRFKGEFAFSKHISTAYTFPPLQMAMAEFLESGQAVRGISFFRKWLRGCVYTYRETILSVFPEGTSVNEPKGGPYLWVSLPEGMSANALNELAKKEGISISPSQLFNAPPEMGSCFRFNCVSLPLSSDSLNAVRKLGKLACSLAE